MKWTTKIYLLRNSAGNLLLEKLNLTGSGEILQLEKTSYIEAR